MLVIAPETMLGTSAMAKITSIGRWSVFGEVIETISTKHHKTTLEDTLTRDKVSPCSNTHETCACSTEPESCACELGSCKGAVSVGDEVDSSRNIPLPEEPKRKNLIEWVLRRRKSQVMPKREETENPIVTERKQTLAGGRLDEWGVVDMILVGGILISTFTIFGLLFHVGSTTLSSSW